MVVRYGEEMLYLMYTMALKALHYNMIKNAFRDINIRMSFNDI
jgi:hypothetical protein